MSRSFRVRSLVSGVMVACAWVAIVAGRPALCEEGTPAEKPAQPAEAAKPAPQPAEAKKAKEKSYRRLPAHYGEVVDEKQRKQIYAIQEEYGPKIDALRAEWEALTRQRDAKAAAVLTPEQLKKVEQLREAAKAKRAGAKKPK